MKQNNLLTFFLEDYPSAPFRLMDINGAGNLIQSYPYSDEESLLSDMVAIGEDFQLACDIG